MTDQAQVSQDSDEEVTQTFDIGTLTQPKARVTYDVPVIFDKNGDAASGFRIVGKNSSEFQDTFEAVRVEGVMKAGKRKAALDTKTKDGASMLVNIMKGNEDKLALAVVVDWFGFTDKGAPVPFDINMVAAMFKRYPTWRERVTSALEDDGNFTPS